MAVTVEPRDSLIWILFSGTVSGKDLMEGLARMAEIEEGLEVMPGRLTDLTGAEGLEIDFTDILTLASARRSRRFPNRFKSALVASNDTQIGFARMFQTLNTNPQIDIRIFPDRDGALAWLVE